MGTRIHSWVRVMAVCALGCIDARAAAPWSLPRIDGRFSGASRLLALPDAPTLRWTITLSSPDPEKRTAALEVTGQGVRLTAELEINAATGNGRWRIVDGQLDAATALAAALPLLGEIGKGLAATGMIELSGDGEWPTGHPRGVVKMTWRDGRLANVTEGWSLDAIGFAGDFFFDSATTLVRSESPAELTIGTITTSRFGARNLLVRALLAEDTSLTVREARVEIAGGDVAIDPCVIPLAPLSIAVKARLTRVGLQDVAALVPEALAEARGRVDGEISLRWSEASGLQLGAGHLAVRKDEPAEVRLVRTPGLISASLSPEILKHYPGLGQIETGEIPLRAEVFEVTFTPEGDSEGRTAYVRLAGGPVDPRLRAPIDLTVNVRGPLESLIKLGTNTRLRVGGPP